ncbi:hypothetical protein [uncultured Pedobacter sp.]|uniref:hypothetical protein n=1 Tax=uncultured Pedobacter sp. TaxID=246139 RepID=UPI0025F6F958|nr:hypothetical protein [uncultured Pedobacter sp.]
MKNLSSIIAFGLIILASACKKPQEIIEEPKVNPPKNVYVAGYENNSSSIKVAKLWKNGVATNLSDGTKETTANGVAVLGNDVYVVGNEYNPSMASYTPIIWKNGIATKLSANGSANAIAIIGSDVYVAGFENDARTIRATLWKNGVASPQTLWNGVAQSVTANGNDIYICGYKVNSNGLSSPVLWKNGSYSDLPTGGNPGILTAMSVAVNGPDVYVLGGSLTGKFLWKNGVLSSIAESGKSTDVYSMFAANNNLYMVGSEYKSSGTRYVDYATLWINGTSSNFANDATANSIFVDGQDVFNAGYIAETGPSKSIAVAWKNGIRTSLTDGTKNARTIAIYVK